MFTMAFEKENFFKEKVTFLRKTCIKNTLLVYNQHCCTHCKRKMGSNLGKHHMYKGMKLALCQSQGLLRSKAPEQMKMIEELLIQQ